MRNKTRYRAKLIVIPLMIIGFIFSGIFLSSMNSNAENIRFTGIQYFLILSIFPPVVLAGYYIYMIKEQRKLDMMRKLR